MFLILLLTIRSDSISTVLLAEWHVSADYFDGDVLNGPVPRLFAPDPAMAKAAISSDTGKAFKDIQRLHSRLFMAEHVSVDEAWGFVGNPRYFETRLKLNICFLLLVYQMVKINYAKLSDMLHLFRQNEPQYTYKRSRFTPSTSAPETSGPSGSSGPPNKRQRTVPDPSSSSEDTNTPTPGTIRSTSVRIRHHKYSLGFFYGI